MLWLASLLYSAVVFSDNTCSAFLLNGKEKPNIIFLVADDLGFADVGYRNGDIISPNIDQMAREGVVLNSSYVQPTCSPSRAAMLTGRYPFKLGLQAPISMDMRQCLPLNETLLPERLQSLGYKTHALGKWHLGFCNWACTPTRRGFDTFYGLYGGSGDKYTHRSRNSDKANAGFDFRINEQPTRAGVRGKYSTNLYGDRAVELIKNHQTSDPMFMWLSFQNVHAPVTVPDQYINMYPGMDSTKAAYYGMVTIMDEYIGKIVTALKDKNMYDNTLVILTTDNGGQISNGANNWPLRGQKKTLFEGGTRGVTIVDGPLLEKRGYTHDGLFHAIDWTPTLMHFADGTDQDDTYLDGVDQFNMLYKGSASKRKEFIYELTTAAAIRVGDYKLIWGSPGTFTGYSEQPTTPTKTSSTQTRAVRQGVAGGRQGMAGGRQGMAGGRQGMAGGRQGVAGGRQGVAGGRQGTASRRQGGVGGRQGQGRPGGSRWPGAGGRGSGAPTLLFNLKEDPTEINDLSTSNPQMLRSLKAKINAARIDYVEQLRPVDSRANPANYGGFWSPGWC